MGKNGEDLVAQCLAKEGPYEQEGKKVQVY